MPTFSHYIFQSPFIYGQNRRVKAKQKLKSSGKWKLCRLGGNAIRLPTPAASRTGSNQVAASFAAWLNIHSKWEPLSRLITKSLLLYASLPTVII